MNIFKKFLKRIIFGKKWEEKEKEFFPLFDKNEVEELKEDEKKNKRETVIVNSFEEAINLYVKSMRINQISITKIPNYKTIGDKIPLDTYKEYQVRGFKYNKTLYIFVPLATFIEKNPKNKRSEYFTLLVFQRTPKKFKLYKAYEFDFDYIISHKVFLKNIVNNPSVRNKVDILLRKEIKREMYSKGQSFSKEAKKNYSISKESKSFTKKNHIVVDKPDSKMEEFNEYRKKENIK